VSDSTVGIKIADGSYYPVLEHGYTGTKKLTVTTVKDNQDRVQIDLCTATHNPRDAAVRNPRDTAVRYLGSLVIENIPPASQGEPEIELLIGIDPEGQLSAEASDSSTGESQKFSTSLVGLPEPEEFPAPDFPAETEGASAFAFEEPPLTGETYPVGDADRREERLHRKGPNLFLLVLFVVLGVLLVAAIAYFVYRSIQGPQIPPLPAATTAAAPAAQPAPKPPAATAPAATAPAATPQPAPAPAATAPAPEPVTYRIKKGDTLWDISATYYRNPWLYPKLAKANSIKNPDLIFAGTRITIPEN
jgi:hypothetical protein